VIASNGSIKRYLSSRATISICGRVTKLHAHCRLGGDVRRSRFFCEWVPMRRRRRILARLAKMPVIIQPK
jgi:hypothetical protein